MQDEEKTPRTARDALLIELLGDLGIIHDLIKNLPAEIDGAVSGSIKVLADAVEDAENTALKLSTGIDAHTKKAIKDINEAVKSSLDQYASETFSDMEENVKMLQHRINHFELADPKSRRLSFILSASLIIVSLFSAAAMFGIYAGTNAKVEELNLIITSQDAKERRGLAALPPQAREQYQSAKETVSN